MGGRLWLWAFLLAIAIAGGAYLIFALIGYAWYAWGLFGMLLVLGVVLIGVAWLFDKREARRRAPM
jgi:hypothetical protein